MPFPIQPFRNLSENIIGMPDTILIKRRTRVSDSEGGFTTGWTTVETTVGRYETAGARELEIAQHLANAVEGTITLPYNTDVRETDQLVRDLDTWIQEGEELIGGPITYNVSGILRDSEDLMADLPVLVRRA